MKKLCCLLYLLYVIVIIILIGALIKWFVYLEFPLTIFLFVCLMILGFAAIGKK